MAKDHRTTDTTLLPTQAFVTRQFRLSGKDVGEAEETDEVLEIHKFATQPANVRVEMGMTINLGNYESAKISVCLSVPCYKEEADAAFEYAKKWVEVKTLEEAAEAKKFASNRSNDPF
jgi:hypothetical protein